MKNISQISLLLPFAFFIAAAIQFAGIADGKIASDYALYIRDGFIFISLLLSLPLIHQQKWASDRNVLRGLRHLFFLILITSGILFLSSRRLDSLQSGLSPQPLISAELGDHIFIISWAFFAIVFILIVLGTLKNLIYIKRKRSTARNFTTLLVLLLLASVTSSVDLYDFHVLENFDFFRYINFAILFVLINFAVINALRVGWINYLKKKQKMGCFWGGLLLLPTQILFLINFGRISPLTAFSPLLERFVEIGTLFLAVYLVMSFLGLLAHLPTAKLYDRKMQQIQSLHDLSRALNSEFDWNKLVRTIVKLASEVTEGQFAWLELYNPINGRLALISSKQLSAEERKSWRTSTESRLRDWLSTTKETMISNQVSKDELLQGIIEWKQDIGSLIAVPLITSDRLLGFLYTAQREEFSFEQEDAEMLRAFCDQAAVAVHNARLVEESLVKERLEQELKIAHEAQMKLLPKEMPVLEGMEIEAVCITANEVGGDYYDFFELDQHRLGIVIGDVSGKGPSAAFYMAEVKGIMEALANEVLSPQEMLTAANAILYNNFDRKTFISLIYGIVDSKRKQFTFCRAGHCPIFYVGEKQDGYERLEPKGLGVGLDSGSIFEKSLQQITVKLAKNHTLLLYTDGVTEARNPQGEEFGEERLAETLVSVRDKNSIDIKKDIIHAIYTFFDGQNAFDDLTFIVIKSS